MTLSFAFDGKVRKGIDRAGYRGNHFDFAQWYPKIVVYDQNGFLDYICEVLNQKQVEYLDLNLYGWIPPGFLGSGVISAVFWEHDVFDGSGTRPWVETDTPAPLSVYGRTKLEGEELIAQSGAKYLILRTSWVYAARGGNFAKTILRLAQERERLTVIDDQWGAPTGADLLADVTAHALRHLQQRPQDAGLYHCVAAGETNWNEYAKYVLVQAKQARPAIEIKAKEVAPVPTSAFPTPAVRPHNSRLDTRKLQSTFGLQMPHWQKGVARMLAEIL